jgi:hypothetical protein
VLFRSTPRTAVWTTTVSTTTTLASSVMGEPMVDTLDPTGLERASRRLLRALVTMNDGDAFGPPDASLPRRIGDLSLALRDLQME